MPAGLADATSTRKQLGIGQRSILIETGKGNVLWDIVAFIDDATVEFIKGKGGLKAIVISHPHFWTTVRLIVLILAFAFFGAILILRVMCVVASRMGAHFQLPCLHVRR